MLADCHIHSLYSDGVYTVRQIIELLLKKNIQVFSLTDHDTVRGIKEAAALSRNKIRFISGIEFTCRELSVPQTGTAFSVHLLGYHFDADNAQLSHALERRAQRVKTLYDDLCGELSAFGYAVFREEIPISCGNVLQLFDVAAHIRMKYPDAQKPAFDLIDSYAPRLDSANIPVEEAVNLIHGAGGAAVWAHPFCVYKNFRKMTLERQEVLAALDALCRIGIDGIEAYYLSFPDEDRKWLCSLSTSRNLIYTAGSDFHGSHGRDRMGIELPCQPVF